MKLLLENWRKYLNEDKNILSEFIKPQEALDFFNKNVRDTPPYYFIHGSKIPKIGINPKSSYNTPLGIYTFILNKGFLGPIASTLGDEKTFYDRINQWFDTTINYSGQDFLFILAAKEPDKVLYTSQPISDQKLQEYLIKIADLATKKPDLFNEKWISKVEKIGGMENFVNSLTGTAGSIKSFAAKFISIPVEKSGANRLRLPVVRFPNNNSAILFDIAKILAAGGSVMGKEKSVRWSSILRNIGIHGFMDDVNLGVIHAKEKNQGLFFAASFIEIVDMWRNPIGRAGAGVTSQSLAYRTQPGAISSHTATSPQQKKARQQIIKKGLSLEEKI